MCVCVRTQMRTRDPGPYPVSRSRSQEVGAWTLSLCQRYACRDMRVGSAERGTNSGMNSGAGVCCPFQLNLEFLKHAGLEQVDAVGGSETLRMM